MTSLSQYDLLLPSAQKSKLEDQFRVLDLDPVPTPSVLIVEDDGVMLRNLQHLIARFDPWIPCSTAKSFEEAKALIEAELPDLLITDFYLNDDKTALDLIRWADGAYPLLDILVVSSGTPLPKLIAAEAEGLCIKFLKKPVDKSKLYRFLQFDLERGYYL